jgi:hypothetical protein
MSAHDSGGNVLLIGSVPMENAEQVFTTVCSALGDRMRRLPDGETGDRINWIGWQYGVLEAHPFFEAVPPDPDAYPALPRVRLRPGTAPSDIRIGPLGYSEAAIRSYRIFTRLSESGRIPSGCRFQVSLPTPLAPVNVFVMPESQAQVEPPYETRLLSELADICRAVPNEHLAIQWDVAVEMAIWEGVWPAHFKPVKEGVIDRLVRLGEGVPEEAELGYHLCYGDYEHHHFLEPKDMSNLVAVANEIGENLTRHIQWIHMPVPKNRTDEAFFTPLRNLRLRPETELYLGVVHHGDGIDGTRKRIAAAARAVSSFGVATECGLGRRPAETIPNLLRIHAQAADSVPRKGKNLPS